MGMDVIGVDPTSDVGRYFRNNVWWWHPLWTYCTSVAPVLCDSCDGRYNEGDGLNRAHAEALADLLQRELESGRTTVYAEERERARAAVEPLQCEYCAGSGVRTDEVGVKFQMMDRELDESEALELNRTHGWCNGCGGVGMVRPDDWYLFDVENVEHFVAFLKACGGFRIW